MADFLTVLTDQQLHELNSVGWTRLPSVVSGRDIDAVVDRIWTFLAKRGVDRQIQSSWPVGLTGKLQGLRQSGLFNVFATDAISNVVDELLGAGTWSESEAWGPALITFPQPGPWQLPFRNWHFDLPGGGDPDRPAAVRLFGFVSRVGPRGGGTLVVEGSHELVCRILSTRPGHDNIQSSDLRRQLARRYHWFAELSQPGADRVERFLLHGDEVDGVRVRVVELTSEPGDVVVMLPWTMHNFSMNCAPSPRFMVTHTALRRDQAFYPAIPTSATRGSAPISGH